MIIERTDDEIIFRIPNTVDTLGIQRMINYLKYKEATTGSNANQADVDKIAEDFKTKWWQENKSQFIK